MQKRSDSGAREEDLLDTARVAWLLLVILLLPACVHSPGLEPLPERYQVRILRDTWGVPHIFGVRDVDVVYGLAWAHAEDDFQTIQISLMASRGRLASVVGRGGASNDYLVHWLRIPETVERGWTRDVTPEARALAEAYAAGINAYAARHRGEVLPGLLPVTGRDLVAGFVHKNGLFQLESTVRVLFDPDRSVEQSDWQANAERESALPVGSNSFAVGPSRSSDGHTRLAVNSHQPWEGPVAWYEVHLHSDQGWDAAGGVFPGSPVILHGHNRHLGWAHTVNRPDLVDLYRLEIDPENPNRYRFDGSWRELERREVPIRVKLLGRLSWTFHREALWSLHGPVVRRHDGTFAVRYGGMGEVGQLDQIYRMNKARDFDEWLAAMRRSAIAMFNTVYADEAGNVYYVYNARIPQRPPGFDWERVVPGNRSETLWSEYLPYDSLPQVLNPSSGFVQNCNSTPFRTTSGAENPQPVDYPERLGIETGMTNRAWRALELLGTDASISAESFDSVKWDMRYSPRSLAGTWIDRILTAPAPEDPLLRRARELLTGWDLSTHPDSTGAALGVLSLMPLLEARRAGRRPPDPTEALQEAAHTLMDHHGRLDVPWREVNRLRRGDLDLGIGGGPDVLHAVYGSGPEKGRLVGRAGDSYVLLVDWGPDGVRSRSIHQYGSATLDKDSPHYADQAPLFSERKLKPVWLDEAEIRAHLEREYRPPQPDGPEE